MKPIAVIPARSGSKRLPGKNWMKLSSETGTLVDIAIGHAFGAGIDDVIVSADEYPMGWAPPSRRGPSLKIDRPADLAADDTPMRLVVTHAAKLAAENGVDFDCVVLLQPTSPLRLSEDIQGTLALLSQGDAAFSVVRTKQPEIYDGGLASRMRLARQAQAGYFFTPNGAVYAITRQALEQGHGFESSSLLYGYEMPASRSVDIDTIDDFLIAARLYMGNRPIMYTTDQFPRLPTS